MVEISCKNDCINLIITLAHKVMHHIQEFKWSFINSLKKILWLPVWLLSPRNIEDVELLHLSRRIPSDKYNDIGILLRFPYNELGGIKQKHQNNINESLLEVFMKWRDGQESSINQREWLAERLRNANLNSFAEDLLNRRLENRGRFLSYASNILCEEPCTKM